MHYSEAKQARAGGRRRNMPRNVRKSLWLLLEKVLALFAFLVHFLTSWMSATTILEKKQKKGEPLRLTTEARLLLQPQSSAQLLALCIAG